MIGKRDNEESYQFSSFQKKKLDIYYGRGNLKNTDPTIKPNPYAYNYVFCADCEEKLGKLEGKVIPIIQDEIRLENKQPNYKEVHSEDGITHMECLRLENNLFRLFIYSIVWRFALIHRIQDGIILLTKKSEEKLRNILDSFLNIDISQITTDVPNLPFQVFTADSFMDKTEGTVYSEDIYKNPMICFANEFIIFFYENGYAVERDYHLPTKLMVSAKHILNNPEENPKIGFISNAYFNELMSIVFRDGSKAIINSLTKTVSDCTSLSNIESRFNLCTMGMDIHQRTGKNIIASLEEAAELICNGQ